MSTINLAKEYRQYSPEELRDLAYRGVLEVNGFDMTDVLEYMFQDCSFTAEEDQDTIEHLRGELYDLKRSIDNAIRELDYE
jgi:DNA-binding transcriptional MerR regulator